MKVKTMSEPKPADSDEVFTTCPKQEPDHLLCRTSRSPDHLSAMMQKDEVIRFLQGESQWCLLHLDEPQQSYFFWLIMEYVCKTNGGGRMADIVRLLFRGYRRLRKTHGRVKKQENWCLPLAKLLCSNVKKDEHREDVPNLGTEFVSRRRWFYAAHICYVIGQMELRLQQRFKLIGCNSCPDSDSALIKALETSEVHEFVLSLTSGLGQPDHQFCELLLRGEAEKPEWLKLHREKAPRTPPVGKPLQAGASWTQISKREFLSHYTVGTLLGSGSFGSVYDGTRKADGKRVAVKYTFKKTRFVTIVSELTEVLRFYREAPGEARRLPVEVALMEMVSRPPRCEYVVKLLEWFETHSSFVLVMERPFPCTDLLNFRKLHKGRLPEPVAQTVTGQLVRAARHCCDCGVIHRDIKSENVLVNLLTMEVKLIDFGCGDLLKAEPYSENAGTPVFWPPEWLLHQTYSAVPASVWSLGVLLFQMLSGDLPFKEDEDIVDSYVPFIHGLSQDCYNLLMWCLDLIPDDRPAFEEILSHDWLKSLSWSSSC